MKSKTPEISSEHATIVGALLDLKAQLDRLEEKINKIDWTTSKRWPDYDKVHGISTQEERQRYYHNR